MTQHPGYTILRVLTTARVCCNSGGGVQGSGSFTDMYWSGTGKARALLGIYAGSKTSLSSWEPMSSANLLPPGSLLGKQTSETRQQFETAKGRTVLWVLVSGNNQKAIVSYRRKGIAYEARPHLCTKDSQTLLGAWPVALDTDSKAFFAELGRQQRSTEGLIRLGKTALEGNFVRRVTHKIYISGRRRRNSTMFTTVEAGGQHNNIIKAG
ncbi:mitochondrial cardiolipin hydrolase isoform X2 [Alligator mississippiensis]|uniref:mitochondrial cardiolipin hydrolase isoform X2 n=1 Tax=Alligator mississippiensis TaxID=8496 RepID=UPI0028779687|nr:mitochondrial cardiolipin hydrolase isoform X2 [Alligator mississippiensis]